MTLDLLSVTESTTCTVTVCIDLGCLLTSYDYGMVSYISHGLIISQ